MKLGNLPARIGAIIFATMLAVVGGAAQAQGDSSSLAELMKTAPMYELKAGKFVRIDAATAKKYMASRPQNIVEGDNMFVADWMKMGPMYSTTKDGKLVRIDMDKSGKITSVRRVDTGEAMSDASFNEFANAPKYIYMHGMFMSVDDMKKPAKK